MNKLKFKKYFLIRYKKNNFKINEKLIKGDFGLKALSPYYIRQEQLDAGLKAIKRFIKKKDKVFINIVPNFTLTNKPQDVRMGRGKGTPALTVFPLKAGKIIYEIRDTEANLAIQALKSSAIRLPIKTKIIKKHDTGTNNVKSFW